MHSSIRIYRRRLARDEAVCLRTRFENDAGIMASDAGSVNPASPLWAICKPRAGRPVGLLTAISRPTDYFCTKPLHRGAIGANRLGAGMANLWSTGRGGDQMFENYVFSVRCGEIPKKRESFFETRVDSLVKVRL